MMVVHLYSPDKSRDTLFISNYATLEMTDALTRVDGVGSITVFGSARLCDAGVARSRSHAVAWIDGERRHQRAARPEHPGRIRHARSAAGRAAGRFPDFGADARPARRSRGILYDRHQGDAERGGALEGRRQGRTRGAGLFVEFLSRSRSRRSRSAIFQRPGSNALETAQGVARPDGEARRSASRPASNTTSSTIRRSSSRSRSTR